MTQSINWYVQCHVNTYQVFLHKSLLFSTVSVSIQSDIIFDSTLIVSSEESKEDLHTHASTIVADAILFGER